MIWIIFIFILAPIEHSGASRPLLVRKPFKQKLTNWHREIPEQNNPGILTSEQIKRFKDDGFLLVENIIGENYLQAIQEDVTDALDRLASKLYKANKISSLYEDYNWTTRMVHIGKEFPDAAVVFTKQGYLHKSLQNIYKNPVLIDIVQQLGLELPIAAHPAWNLRVKIPNHEETEVPFHQDNSYWETRLWHKEILSVWIPIVDATEENGAMEFVTGGHLTGKTCGHTIPFKNTWYTETSPDRIQDELLNEIGRDFSTSRIVVPAKRGDMLIFGNTLPHRSVPNHSNGVRWSIDLRYHTADENKDGKSHLDYFYGLKDSLIVHDAAGSEPDFETWAGQDRTKLQNKDFNKAPESDFDPIIIGPWMDLWNITKSNRHINAYLNSLPGITG